MRVRLCVSELLSGCPSVESVCCVFPRSCCAWLCFRFLSFDYSFQVFLYYIKQRELGREEFKSERENGEAETDAAVGGRVGGKIKFGVSS